MKEHYSNGWKKDSLIVKEQYTIVKRIFFLSKASIHSSFNNQTDKITKIFMTTFCGIAKLKKCKTTHILKQTTYSKMCTGETTTRDPFYSDFKRRFL